MSNPQERSLLTGMRDGQWLDSQEFPELGWHIEGIIPEGVTVLVGAPKVGKSWIVLGFALAIAAGVLALGGIPCERRRVMYFALEDSDRRMQSRCRALLTWRHAPRDPIPEMFTYMTRVPAGQLVATVAEYLELCGDEQPLIIIDTLGKVMPPAITGETTYQRDYRVMSDLQKLTGEWPGTALVICHHDRKAIAPDFVDQVSGTNGIAGGADTIVLLTRDRQSEEGLVQVTGRDVIEGAYALRFAEGRWKLDGDDLAQAGQNAKRVAGEQAASGRGEYMQQVNRTLVQLVSSLGKPATPAQVAEAAELDISIVRKYLNRLYQDGRIDKPERGLYSPRVQSVQLSTAPTGQLDTLDTDLEEEHLFQQPAGD